MSANECQFVAWRMRSTCARYGLHLRARMRRHCLERMLAEHRRMTSN